MWGVRLLLIVIVMEAGMWFALDSAGLDPGIDIGRIYTVFGNDTGANESQNVYVSFNQTNTIDPVGSIVGFGSSVFGLIQGIFEIFIGALTLPYRFFEIAEIPHPVPLFVQLLFSIAIIGSLAQFIRGASLS